MKISIYASAALAASTSFSCFVSAAASRKIKIQKKTSSAATGSSGQPGATCKTTSDCAIPPGLDHGVCHDGTCKSGTPGSYCGVTSDCVVPPGLDHAVCRDGRCQSGTSGSSCGATSDCVVPTGIDHAICRHGECQRGVCWDYCGQDSDCLSGLHCVGATNIAMCNKWCCEYDTCDLNTGDDDI